MRRHMQKGILNGKLFPRIPYIRILVSCLYLGRRKQEKKSNPPNHAKRQKPSTFPFTHLQCRRANATKQGKLQLRLTPSLIK